ncbi:POLG alternative reading frame-like [Meriones unguiculatus]|uniref:POLG alternative reading frame-like n=1 Tax=Meriones unguiculatus TaxID=10047 RepID=UPI000B4EC4B9|nr:POLG alternative reading frame-like [Meriones unguiculatus]
MARGPGEQVCDWGAARGSAAPAAPRPGSPGPRAPSPVPSPPLPGGGRPSSARCAVEGGANSAPPLGGTTETRAPAGQSGPVRRAPAGAGLRGPGRSPVELIGPEFCTRPEPDGRLENVRSASRLGGR